MAQLVPTTQEHADVFEYRRDDNFNDYLARSEKALNDLYATSDALADGDVVGLMIDFPYADGRAYYRVVSAKPLKVEHIPYGDAWHIDDITMRGLRMADVLKMQQRNRALARLEPMKLFSAAA